jgi:hypothetical protein
MKVQADDFTETLPKEVSYGYSLHVAGFRFLNFETGNCNFFINNFIPQNAER